MTDDQYRQEFIELLELRKKRAEIVREIGNLLLEESKILEEIANRTIRRSDGPKRKYEKEGDS